MHYMDLKNPIFDFQIDWTFMFDLKRLICHFVSLGSVNLNRTEMTSFTLLQHTRKSSTDFTFLFYIRGFFSPLVWREWLKTASLTLSVHISEKRGEIAPVTCLYQG